MNFDTYDSKVTFSDSSPCSSVYHEVCCVGNSNTSLSECDLNMEFLRIIYAIDNSPYRDLSQLIAVHLQVSRGLSKLWEFSQQNGEFQERVVAFMRNNRLNYIIQRIVLAALKKQGKSFSVVDEKKSLLDAIDERKSLLDAIDKRKSLLDAIDERKSFDAIDRVDALELISRVTEQIYKINAWCNEAINVDLTMDLLEIATRRRNNAVTINSAVVDNTSDIRFNQIVTTILTYAPPRVAIFEFLQSSIDSCEDQSVIHYTIYDIGVLFGNLYSNRSLLGSREIQVLKFAASAILLAIVEKNYHEINLEAYKVIKHRYSAIFCSPYSNNNDNNNLNSGPAVEQNSDLFHYDLVPIETPALGHSTPRQVPESYTEDISQWVRHQLLNENSEDERPTEIEEGQQHMFETTKPKRRGFSRIFKRKQDTSNLKRKSKWNFFKRYYLQEPAFS
ncbi:hypothetical protein KGF56_002411 [Candida oxycetoniae]|uniref:Uncharacterized protein n=1 Tax=Candida oxycetoniae TaxID=497107 RepID=A0AAI9SXY4_9ASCO|nr:uncharacterized protein KGF56_002411 [Candida oxycetoniae]KAI3404781.2 hypothetical protein KGF56_002411 [Candida oxycetoniae]